MTKSKCENCGNACYWDWEGPIDKFGFGDGDAQIETWRVRAALEDAGYDVEETDWGLHNSIIYAIRKDGGLPRVRWTLRRYDSSIGGSPMSSHRCRSESG